MRFSFRISTLLAGLIILLSLHAVDSLSVSIRRPESQFFTLPLNRIQQRSDIHPQIVRDQIPNCSEYSKMNSLVALANAH